MCRLFGMSGGRRRVRATFWLLDAPDSLAGQSRRQPDGTGLGYFHHHNGKPVVHKQPLPAYADRAFRRDARLHISRTFIAHVRYATGGGIALENTHPFELRGRLFAHNGVLRGLDALERELGPELASVQGATDSERYFALVTREIERAGGNVERGVVAAAEWIAERLPVYALNVVLTTADEVWALRYPETHELYVLENAHGLRFGSRSLHLHLQERGRTVLVASEPLDENPDWRLLDPGELVHIGPDLEVEARIAVSGPPAQLLTHADLYPEEATSQSA